MSKNKKIIILFSGYSVNNTPKLENLINSLQNEGYSLSLFGIVKDRSNNLKNVNTTYLYSKGNTQGLFKIFCVFYYIIKLCIYLIFKSRKVKIYAINPISGVIALLVSKIGSNKYIYESHEMIFGLNYPFFRGKWRHFWRFLEKNIIKKSDFFFTTDEFRLKFISRYYKIKRNKIGYILNVPQAKKLMLNKNILKEKLSLKNKFVVSYCGGIIKGRGIELIIDAFSNFYENKKDCVLVLAGSVEDVYLNELNRLIIKLKINVDSIIFTGKLKNTLLMKYMYASDITFALYNNISLNNRMCSPNKIFDALHSKTHVITTDSFLTNKIFSDKMFGEVIKHVDSHNILLALKNFYTKQNKIYNDKIWLNTKKEYSWESEFERVKSNILIDE